MRAKHLRQILKLASQLVKILKNDPEVSESTFFRLYNYMQIFGICYLHLKTTNFVNFFVYSCRLCWMDNGWMNRSMLLWKARRQKELTT